MDLQHIIPWKINRFMVAAVVIFIAAALRIWPLQILQERVVWLTFYPAITIAAVYGGFAAGLLATALSCVIATFFWQLLVANPFIKDFADWLGMVIFFLNCMIISGAAEAMLRANASARKAKEKAEESNKAKSVFLANMSHELRTPLNAILGFSELMRYDADLSLKQRETLDIINRSGKNLLTLINDVLDMAKIEAGGIVIESGIADLDELLSDTINLMHLRAEEKGLLLLREQSPDFHRFVRADAAKLRQILINLIGNAIKFTPQGSITLRMNTRSTENCLLLNIEVEDSGIGIASENLSRIFEPFVQVGKQATQKGTGLGLSITRNLVEMMGGRISVESTPGKGSIFRVEVPVELAEATEMAPAKASRKRVIGLESGQPEYRILIVEDQQENWQLLQRLLEDAGLQVRVAENGVKGIEAYTSWRPHFIWMDIRMPVMDGLEAARHIRELEGGRKVKIVALTASAFRDERDNILAAGMDDFVSKPFRTEEIFDCMAQHLNARFVYDETAVDSFEKSATDLLHEALALLPDELRRQLGDALVSLDAARIAEQIRRIAELNPALGDLLAHHADRLAYNAILRHLNTSNSTEDATP